MFSEANIVVTIGNYGAVVAFHGRASIENKIFLDKLDDEAKTQLKAVFEKNKSAFFGSRKTINRNDQISENLIQAFWQKTSTYVDVLRL